MAAVRDTAPDMTAERLASFIGEYRSRRLPPIQMLGACLQAIPGSNASDYAIALSQANRRRAAAEGRQ